MNTTVYPLSDKLALVHTYDNAAPKAVKLKPPAHHVLVLDCSGSMSGSLSSMVENLSSKLYTMVGVDDCLSVVWFSGRGEHGVVVERAKLATLKDVAAMQKLFARWLRPVGLTGFKEPLTDVRTLLGSAKGESVSLYFLSDGCDNQWSREEIMKEIDALAPSLSAATVVEYGYYADRAMLVKMAERFGGSHIFADDLVAFQPSVERAIKGQTDTGPRVTFKLDEAMCQVGFNFGDGRIRTFETDFVTGDVSVPESVLMGGGIFHLRPLRKDDVASSYPLAMLGSGALYAALSVFAARMMPEVCLPILRVLGDVHFIKRYTTLFGKQAYSAFMNDALAAAFDEEKRMVEGFDQNAVPADEAFTVLDLLELLQNDPSARIHLDHEKFRYSRISRKRLDDTEGEQLVFVCRKAPDGYPVSALTWNEDRANISVLVKREGTVDLSKRLPFKGKVPEVFETFQWRNYSIVADGLRNVDVLPISASPDTIREIANKGVPLTPFGDGWGGRVLIDLSAMPILSRAKVKKVTARELFAKSVELAERRAAIKVYKTYLTEARSETWDERYGKEGADWLKSQGITPGGYQPPKTKQVEATDYYLAKVLEVKIKGWSSLPSVKDVTSGKSKNGPGLFMRGVVEQIEEKKKVLGAKFDAWVASTVEVMGIEIKALTREVAKAKFAIIVSGQWFPEFKSLDERAVLTLDVAGKPTEVEAVVSEEKILL